MRTRIFTITKLGIVILFLATIIILGIYSYPNHSIKIVIETSDGNEISKTFTVSEIKNFYSEKDEEQKDNVITEVLVKNENFNSQTTIKQVKFFRKFKTISVDMITSDRTWEYISVQDGGVLLGAKLCSRIKDLSESYILERLFFAEVALAVALFLWIIVNALQEKYDENNRGNHGPIYEIRRFFAELFKYREYIFFAAKADLNAEVANSYLNRLWWVLEPFFNMLVYIIVFGRVMGNSIENYATFVFSALLMWNYFNHIMNYSVKCVRNNRDIVSKIYMPKYVLLLTNMVLNFIKLLFSMLVLIVMLIVFKVNVGICVLWVIPAFLLMIILSFGVGMILLHYGVFIDDLSYAVGILLTMLMFLSGIFYNLITTLTAPLNTIMLCVNPVAMFVDTMRSALLDNIITNVPLIIIWFILGILVMYIGLHTVYKNENGYVKVI